MWAGSHFSDFKLVKIARKAIFKVSVMPFNIIILKCKANDCSVIIAIPGEKDRVNTRLVGALMGTTWLYAGVCE